jgi:hypothetical protein
MPFLFVWPESCTSYPHQSLSRDALSRLEFTCREPKRLGCHLPAPVETMEGSKRTTRSQSSSKTRGAEDERLNRALVTGLMLEVILETSTFQTDPQVHRRQVKTRLKNILVTHLAGRVTLDRFRNLLLQLDNCFPRYYPLIAPGSPQGPVPVADRTTTISPTTAPAPPPHRVLREDVLGAWLEAEIRKLLPQRSHRKIGVTRLFDFLQCTQGSWFRLKDFEQHFGVDRKTAWEYLQKFLSVGLLRHNHERSAAVRYALATRFLVVLADSLEPKVREALSDLPRRQADQVCDWLIATGGEPFGEAEWTVHLKGSRYGQIIATLQASGLLEEVSTAGESPMFQLPRHWLQD